MYANGKARTKGLLAVNKPKNTSDTDEAVVVQPDFYPVKFALEKFFQEHKRSLQRKHARVEGKRY